jgi:hypothetical protein
MTMGQTTESKPLPRSAILILVGLLACTVSCDPGHTYSPEGWLRTRDGRWTFENNDLRIDLWTPGHLVGSRTLTPEADVRNLTNELITFESATLATGEQTLSGSFGQNSGDRQAIDPGETKRIPVFFRLDGPALQSLGKRLELAVTYRVGTGRQEIVVIGLVRRK